MKNNFRNPYIAGAPLRSTGFFGRQNTIDQVIQELTNTTNNALLIVGQRRIGKTSLLLQLERVLDGPSFIPIYFDLQDQATRPLGEVLGDLADTISEKLHIECPELSAFDNQGKYFQEGFLPDIYKLTSKSSRLVFLFDEFDVLDQVDESELPNIAAAKALFPFLRKVMQNDRSPVFVFVLGRRIDDLSLDFISTFKSSVSIELWVLDRISAVSLIKQAETDGPIKYSESAIERILKFTSGHPYLTQLLCQRVWERSFSTIKKGEKYLISDLDIEAAVDDAIKVGDHALYWVWNGLSPAEKIYASALAEITNEGEIITADRVIGVLEDHGTRLRTREVELAPHDLVKRQILEPVEAASYRYAIELFRRWIQQKKPLQEVKKELDQIDPLADQLYKLGVSYFNKRKWDMAKRYFGEALEANNKHFSARLFLGETYLAADQVDEAISILQEAYQQDNVEGRLPLTRALLTKAQLLEKDHADKALTLCTKVLEISPADRTANNIHSRIWKKRGEVALAAKDLETALICFQNAYAKDSVKQVELLIQENKDLGDLYIKSLDSMMAQDWNTAQRLIAEIIHKQPDYRHDRRAVDLLIDAIEHRAPVENEKRKIPVSTQKTIRERVREYLPIILGIPGVIAFVIMMVLILGGWRGKVIEISGANWEEITTIGTHRGNINALALSPDGAILATASNDNRIKLWQTSGGTLIRTLDGHRGDVHSISFSSEGDLLASGSDDNTIRIWDAHNGNLQRTIDTEGNVESLAFVPNSTTVAAISSGSLEWTLDLWDATNGSLIGENLMQTQPTDSNTLNIPFYSPRDLLFTLDGTTLAVSSYDGISLWDTGPFNLRTSINVYPIGMAFSPDGNMLAVGSNNAEVWVWQLPENRLLFSLGTPQIDSDLSPDRIGSSITCLAFSNDGTLIAVGFSNGAIELWNITTRTLVHTQRLGSGSPGDTLSILSITFSSDDKIIYIGTNQ